MISVVEELKSRIFSEKLAILRDELRMMQGIVDKYDDISFKIRGWEITIWSALIVASFQFQKAHVLLVAAFIPVVFLFFDTMYKTYRMNYKMRVEKIASFLKSKDFEKSIKEKNLYFPTPVFPEHGHREILKNLFRPHNFVLHVALFLISIAILFLAA